MSRTARGFFMVFMLMIMAIGTVQPVFAQGVELPKKNGYIQDLGGVISADSMPYVEAAIKDKKYQYYLLTLPRIDPSYTSKIYEAWELTKNDILIIYIKESNQMYIEYKNDELEQQIASLAKMEDPKRIIENPRDSFIFTYTFDLLFQGKIARASISIVEEIEKLAREHELSAKEEAKLTVPAVPKVTDQDHAPVVKPEERSNTEVAQPQAGLSIYTWGLWITGAAALLLILLLIVTIIRRIVMKRKLIQRIPSLMADASRLLEHAKPYIELYQGMTLAQASSLNKQSTNILIALETMLRELKQMRWSRAAFPSYGRELQLRIQVYAKYTEDMERIKGEMTNIEDTERNLISAIQEGYERLKRIEDKIVAEMDKYGWPLDGLFERYRYLLDRLGEAGKLDTFDPMGSNQIVVQFRADAIQLERDVLSISKYAAKYDQFSNDQRLSRLEFEDIVQEYGLMLHRIDPYGLLEQGFKVNESMMVHLQAGEMPEVYAAGDQVYYALTEAVRVTRHFADLQVQTGEDIMKLEALLQIEEIEQARIRGLHARIKSVYQIKHWEQVWHDYNSAITQINGLKDELDEIRKSCKKNVQEYDLAAPKLEQAFQLFEEHHYRQNEYELTVDNLDQMFKLAKDQSTRGKEAVAEGNMVLKKNYLKNRWSEEEKKLTRLDQGITKLLRKKPYDVELFAELSEQFVAEAEMYLQDIERAIVWKKRSEDELRSLEFRFNSMYNKSRGTISVASYDYEFSMIKSEVLELIEQGEFIKAEQKMKSISKIISNMKSVYKVAAAKEQKEKQAAARDKEEQKRKKRR